MERTSDPGRMCTLSVTVAGGARVQALVPPPLLPQRALDLARLTPALDAANRAIGSLDGVASVLPGTPPFLYMYVRKEALLYTVLESARDCCSRNDRARHSA